MQRRHFPASAANSILLYGFGLALALSLLFNGYLLYKQSRQRSLTEYELGKAAYSLPNQVWQQQFSDCQRANLQKDSLIHQLAQTPYAPPGRKE